MSLSAGTRLGAYEIVQPLGAGGMGEVYRAWDPKLGRHVAIKVLAPHLASDPAALARFEREARAVAALFSISASRRSALPRRRKRMPPYSAAARRRSRAPFSAPSATCPLNRIKKRAGILRLR